jgi:YVTN family beta-propeller protein
MRPGAAPASARQALVVALLVATLAACGEHSSAGRPHSSALPRPAVSSREPSHTGSVAAPFRDPLPGMPVPVDNNVYAGTRAGMLSPVARRAPSRLFVPDSTGSTVDVISQRSRRIVRVLHVGYLSQHVVPSYDLRRLVVNSSAANRLTFLDPRTGRERGSVTVTRPYNLYYTPDGRQAVVMVEQLNTIRFSRVHSFRRIADVRPRGCRGPNHADFSANGRFFVVTCEFSGELAKISTTSHHVLGVLRLAPRPTSPHASSVGLMGMSMPQDIRISPDGRTFYVADMGTNEVRLVDAQTLRQRAVIGLPSHPHGLYPSRDGTRLYISDRGAGKVSVLDFATNRIVDTWTIPGGGSPDMGGVSADGRMLWLSGRYDGVVYGFRTRDGKLVARIHVGGSPHGLAVWPQPGAYSLGHTGDMR